MASVGRESARTNGALVSAILRRLGHETTGETNRAVIRETLRDAVNFFNGEREWMDRLLTSTITLVAATSEYDLPARYRRSFGRAWFQDTSEDRALALPVVTYQNFLQSVTSEGVSDSLPSLLTLANRVDTGQAILWPAPTAANIVIYPKVELVYFAEIPYSEDDNDNLEVSSILEQAIVEKAITIANDIIGDEKKAQRFEIRSDQMAASARRYDGQMRLNPSNLRGSSLSFR